MAEVPIECAEEADHALREQERRTPDDLSLADRQMQPAVAGSEQIAEQLEARQPEALAVLRRPRTQLVERLQLGWPLHATHDHSATSPPPDRIATALLEALEQLLGADGEVLDQAVVVVG